MGNKSVQDIKKKTINKQTPSVNKQSSIISKQLLKKENNKKIFWYLLVIVVITFIAYSGSLKNDFANWDDDEQIINNKDIKSLTLSSVKTIFTSFYVGMYQPLTSLSFAIEYHKFKQDDAMPYHIDNLILHLLDVILVFFFIYGLTRRKAIAGIIALLFGVHPMHVESVAWITERKDVLYAFFFLGGLNTYILYRKGGSILYLCSTYILFLLSLLSKSAAVCFPLVIILTDYYLSNKLKFKHVLENLPLFIISIIFGIIALKSQQKSGAVADLTPTYSIFERLFIVCYSASSYIIKMFVPIGLCAMHYFPIKVGGAMPWEFYGAVVFIIAIASTPFLIKDKKYKKDMIFGLLFFGVTIVMVLQIIPIGFSITSERYTYIPYIGLMFPLIRFFDNEIEIRKKTSPGLKTTGQIIMAAIIVIFSIGTYNRCKVWENGIALFTDVIDKNPNMFHGYWIRGSAYSNKKDYKSAISDFDNALQHNPPNAAEILNNLGNAEYNVDPPEYKNALIHLDNAIKINPKLAEAYSNRGNVKDNMNDQKGALEDLNKALQLKPDMITALNNRGVVYGKQGRIDEAIKDFNKAIEINPYDPAAYLNRGNAKGVVKDYAGSIQDLSIAIQYNPKEGSAYFNRAISEISLKNNDAACKDWQQALSLGDKVAEQMLNKYCK